MHSIRMRTTRLLPVDPRMHYSGGVYRVRGCARGSYLVLGGVHGPCVVYQVPGGFHGPGGYVPGHWGDCTWYHQGLYLVARGCSRSQGVYMVQGEIPGHGLWLHSVIQNVGHWLKFCPDQHCYVQIHACTITKMVLKTLDTSVYSWSQQIKLLKTNHELTEV